MGLHAPRHKSHVPLLHPSSSNYFIVLHFRINMPVKFPHKLYEMLEYAANSEHASVVSWIDEGQAFVIHDKGAFLEHIVPRFFKQTKYRSFVSQGLRLCQNFC